MNEKLISIIIPVYNTELYLEQCVQSLIGQTYRNLELIFVDDGSTDRSLKILQSYAIGDKRIRVFARKNQGVSLARNFGLTQARGEYIAFLDSDDWLDVSALEKAVETAETENTDIVFWSYVREYPNRRKPVSILGGEKRKWDKNNVDQLYRRLIGLTKEELREPQKIDSLVTIWGKLYRRQIVEGIHFLESDIIGSTGEDLMYNVAVFSRITSAVYLPNTYSHYRKSNVTSITHSYKKNLVQKWKKQYELIREQLEQENQREIFFEALSNRIALGLIGLGMSLVNDTTLTMEEKKKELNRVLNMQQYKSAFEKLDLSYFSVQWKIFFLLAKQRNSCMVYQLLAIMNRMRGH